MDSVGSFGRTVKDAVHGLNAITRRDKGDAVTLSSSRVQEDHYVKFVSTKEVLRGARFGTPWKRCWELVPDDQMKVAQKVLDAIIEAGGEIIQTDFPCAEERIPEDGEWDW